MRARPHTANLTGHDSHGVIRVPVYIRWKKMGSVVPNQNAEVVVDTPSLAVVDGKFGYGQTVTPLAVRIGIDAFGEHKGSGLAFICELLGGALTGTGATAPDRRFANGMLAFYVDPKVVDTSHFF